MSVVQFLVTNPKELALLNKFFARRYPDQETPVKVYVYSSYIRGTELKIIRYVLADGTAVSYNLPAGLFEIFKTKVRENRWEWMIRPNQIKELLHLTVGPKKEHQFQHNRNIINHYLMNVNKLEYSLPEEAFTAEQPNVDIWGDVTSGDIQHVEAYFSKVANIGTDMIRQIHANLKLLDADINTVKDHDLYFCFHIDKTDFTVYPSLNRINPHLPESGQVMIETQPVVIEDYDYLSPIGRSAIATLNEASERFNVTVTGFLAAINKHPILVKFGEDLMLQLYGQLTGAGHMVYTFQYEAAKPLIEALANEVLGKLSKLDGIIGLDINSWRTWDYTNIEEPVLVTAVDFESDIYNRYTESFMTAFYNYCITLNTPLLRPYSRREKVAPERIKDHAIGSIRINKF